MKITTHRQCETAKCNPDGSPADHVIVGQRGLRLRVMKSGFKSWSLLYTDGEGKKKRHPIGEFSAENGLKKACQEAEIARAAIFKGADPVEEKKQAKAEAAAKAAAAVYTYAQLADDYFEEHAKVNTKTWRAAKQRLKFILPHIGHLPADKVTRQDVIAVLNKKAFDEGFPGMANCIQKLMCAIGGFGVREKNLPVNPAWNIKPRGENVIRTRTLTRDEIRRFWAFMDVAPTADIFRDIFKLALLTGQRQGEICGARHSEFDWEKRLWTIPAGSRHDLTLPLWMRALPR